MKSTRYSLSIRDFLKGFLIAVGTPAVYYLLSLLPVDMNPQLHLLLSAFAAYLIKNFFTDDVKVAEKVLDQATADQIESRKTSL